MSIFIKAGLWLEKKTGYKGEFNLTRYVTDLIASTPSVAPGLQEVLDTESTAVLTSDVNISGTDKIINLGTPYNNDLNKLNLSLNGDSDWDIGESLSMYNSNSKASIYFNNNLELRGRSLTGSDYGYIYLGGGSTSGKGVVLIGAGKSVFADVNPANGKVFILELDATNSLASFKDTTTTPKGLQYGGDYSANYTDRSLVDKGYVASIARPYKVYTALLTQVGTDAPTAIVLENTLGVNVTYAYSIVGEYIGTATGALTQNKTAFFITNGSHSSPNFFTESIGRLSVDSFIIGSQINGVFTNGILNQATIEIRVYN